MPLGTEVGLGPNDMLDGDPAPPLRKGAQQPAHFGPCLLWQLLSCCFWSYRLVGVDSWKRFVNLYELSLLSLSQQCPNHCQRAFNCKKLKSSESISRVSCTYFQLASTAVSFVASTLFLCDKKSNWPVKSLHNLSTVVLFWIN